MESIVTSSGTECDRFGRVLSTDELGTRAAGVLVSRVLRDVLRANDSLIAGIEIRIIENPSFNAVATSRGDTHNISLFMGIPETLITVIPSWLARPDTWSSIGNPSNEDGGSLPHDPKRSIFAAEALTATLHFVVSHEFGHILRGHLNFLASQFGKQSLPELAYGRADLFPSRVLRAMEIDADTMAAVNFTDNAIHGTRESSHLSPSDFLRARFFGLGVLFALLSQADKAAGDATALKGPGSI